MSEHQYYEFQSLDQPLTPEKKAFVQSLSSRAQVSTYKASFVYNYGDFRGDIAQLMSNYFDIMVYTANWGSRHLRFRLPRDLIDMRRVASFCVSDAIDHWVTDDGGSVVLALLFNDEEGADWIDEQNLLDELAPLREELLAGDFRVLYLAWLRAAKQALEAGDINESSLEPPVPAGLAQLSMAQKAFVEFIELDDALVHIGTEQSDALPNQVRDRSGLVKQLPEADKIDFLKRLSRNENGLTARLNRRLDKLTPRQATNQKTKKSRRRASDIFADMLV